MYNTKSGLQCPEGFTFRTSWWFAINRIRSKSMRNRIMNHIIEYAFTHRFVLTGNATIDAIVILATEQIDEQFEWFSGIVAPEPEPEPESTQESRQESESRQEPTTEEVTAEYIENLLGINDIRDLDTDVDPRTLPYPYHMIETRVGPYANESADRQRGPNYSSSMPAAAQRVT